MDMSTHPQETNRMEENRLLKRAEVAAQLSVSLIAVRKLERSGALPFVSIAPHTRRFRPEDVARYVAEHRNFAPFHTVPTGTIAMSVD
jgi:predicted site-specific integrase-resolvase